jgi:hypothetical protein
MIEGWGFVWQFFAGLSGRPAFWSSVFFLLLLPWVPLLAEWGATGDVKPSSWQIFVALYGLGLGAASRYEVSFGFGVVVAIIFSISYGSSLTRESDTAVGPGGVFSSDLWVWFSIIVGIVLAIGHGAERYTRHVQDEAPFFEWF